MGKKRGSKKRSGSIDQAVTGAIQDLTAADEDLSMQRHDEETALSAIYGSDFSLCVGAWNCPLYKIRIRRASEVTDHGGGHQHDVNKCDDTKKMELTLQIQLNKKYPYSIPMIQLTNVIGIPTTRMSELLHLLQTKAKECADTGVVMGWELGQVVEEYLVDYTLKLEQENKQRERDLIGQYATSKQEIHGDIDFNVQESHSADDDEHALMSPYSPGRESLDNDIQKEMARQIQALDHAEKMRERRRQERGGVTPRQSEIEEGNEDGDTDDFFRLSDAYKELDSEPPLTSSGSSFSRYETDFVELAPLGRGGGGEVVKAINRLDRRIYAIKRIVLESEELQDQLISNKDSTTKNQWAVIQNQKLRREVTTISRMTHKNIVRYYQAWVESRQQDNVLLDKSQNSAVKSNEEDDDQNNDMASSDDSWSSTSYASNSSSSSDEPIENIIRKQSQHTASSYARSMSLDNFLEHEMKDFSNPFLFHDQDHGEQLRYPGTATSSQLESDSDVLQRERGQSLDGSKKTLYIQVRMRINLKCC